MYTCSTHAAAICNGIIYSYVHYTTHIYIYYISTTEHSMPGPAVAAAAVYNSSYTHIYANINLFIEHTVEHTNQ